MSKRNFEEFLNSIKSNKDLKQKIDYFYKNYQNDLISFAKKKGFNFTTNDINNYEEILDKNILKYVSAGKGVFKNLGVSALTGATILGSTLGANNYLEKQNKNRAFFQKLSKDEELSQELLEKIEQKKNLNDEERKSAIVYFYTKNNSSSNLNKGDIENLISFYEINFGKDKNINLKNCKRCINLISKNSDSQKLILQTKGFVNTLIEEITKVYKNLDPREKRIKQTIFKKQPKNPIVRRAKPAIPISKKRINPIAPPPKGIPRVIKRNDEISRGLSKGLFSQEPSALPPKETKGIPQVIKRNDEISKGLSKGLFSQEPSALPPKETKARKLIKESRESQESQEKPVPIKKEHPDPLSSIFGRPPIKEQDSSSDLPITQEQALALASKGKPPEKETITKPPERKPISKIETAKPSNSIVWDSTNKLVGNNGYFYFSRKNEISREVTITGLFKNANITDNKLVIPSEIKDTSNRFLFKIINIDNENTEGVFNKNKAIKSVVIEEGIKSLGKNCFFECNSLESVTLPNSLVSLGESCFYGCSSIKSITFPENLTNLGKSCFHGCKKLETIEFKSKKYFENKETIYNDHFKDCPINKVTIYGRYSERTNREITTFEFLNKIFGSSDKFKYSATRTIEENKLVAEKLTEEKREKSEQERKTKQEEIEAEKRKIAENQLKVQKELFDEKAKKFNEISISTKEDIKKKEAALEKEGIDKNNPGLQSFFDIYNKLIEYTEYLNERFRSIEGNLTDKGNNFRKNLIREYERMIKEMIDLSFFYQRKVEELAGIKNINEEKQRKAKEQKEKQKNVEQKIAKQEIKAAIQKEEQKNVEQEIKAAMRKEEQKNVEQKIETAMRKEEQKIAEQKIAEQKKKEEERRNAENQLKNQENSFNEKAKKFNEISSNLKDNITKNHTILEEAKNNKILQIILNKYDQLIRNAKDLNEKFVSTKKNLTQQGYFNRQNLIRGYEKTIKDITDLSSAFQRKVRKLVETKNINEEKQREAEQQQIEAKKQEEERKRIELEKTKQQIEAEQQRYKSLMQQGDKLEKIKEREERLVKEAKEKKLVAGWPDTRKFFLKNGKEVSEIPGSDLPSNLKITEIESNKEKLEERIGKGKTKLFTSLPAKFYFELLNIQQDDRIKNFLPRIFQARGKLKPVREFLLNNEILIEKFKPENFEKLGWNSIEDYQKWLNLPVLTAFSSCSHYCSAERVFEYKGSPSEGIYEYYECEPNKKNTIDIFSVAGFEFRQALPDGSFERVSKDEVIKAFEGPYGKEGYQNVIKKEAGKIISQILFAANNTKTQNVVLIPFGMGVFLGKEDTLKLKNSMLDGWAEALNNYKGSQINIYCCLEPGQFDIISKQLTNQSVRLLNFTGRDAYTVAKYISEATKEKTILVNAGDHDWIASFNKSNIPGQFFRKHRPINTTSDEYYGIMTLFGLHSIKNLIKNNILNENNLEDFIFSNYETFEHFGAYSKAEGGESPSSLPSRPSPLTIAPEKKTADPVPAPSLKKEESEREKIERMKSSIFEKIREFKTKVFNNKILNKNDQKRDEYHDFIMRIEEEIHKSSNEEELVENLKKFNEKVEELKKYLSESVASTSEIAKSSQQNLEKEKINLLKFDSDELVNYINQKNEKNDPNFSKNFIEEISLFLDHLKGILDSEPGFITFDEETQKDAMLIGDLHGNFKTASRLYKMAEEFISENEKNKVFFLGDWTNRKGNLGDSGDSFITVMLVLQLKAKFPEKVFLLRGNHEDEKVTSDLSHLVNSDLLKILKERKVTSDAKNTWEISYNTYSKIKTLNQSIPIASIFQNIFMSHAGLPILDDKDLEGMNREKLREKLESKSSESALEGKASIAYSLMWGDAFSDRRLNQLYNNYYGDFWFLKMENRKQGTKFLTLTGCTACVHAHLHKNKIYSTEYARTVDSSYLNNNEEFLDENSCFNVMSLLSTDFSDPHKCKPSVIYLRGETKKIEQYFFNEKENNTRFFVLNDKGKYTKSIRPESQKVPVSPSSGTDHEKNLSFINLGATYEILFVSAREQIEECIKQNFAVLQYLFSNEIPRSNGSYRKIENNFQYIEKEMSKSNSLNLKELKKLLGNIRETVYFIRQDIKDSKQNISKELQMLDAFLADSKMSYINYNLYEQFVRSIKIMKYYFERTLNPKDMLVILQGINGVKKSILLNKINAFKKLSFKDLTLLKDEDVNKVLNESIQGYCKHLDDMWDYIDKGSTDFDQINGKIDKVMRTFCQNEFRILEFLLQKIHNDVKPGVDGLNRKADEFIKNIKNASYEHNKRNFINYNENLRNLAEKQKNFLNVLRKDFELGYEDAKDRVFILVNNALKAFNDRIFNLESMIKLYERGHDIDVFCEVYSGDSLKILETSVDSKNRLNNLSLNIDDFLGVAKFISQGSFAKVFELANKDMSGKQSKYVIKIQRSAHVIDASDYDLAVKAGLKFDKLHGTVKPLISLKVETHLGEKLSVNIFKKRDFTFQMLFKKKEKSNLNILVNVMGSLLNSVSSIHEQGLYHGDIHGGNVLIKEFTGDDKHTKHRCLLSDFGNVDTVRSKLLSPTIDYNFTEDRKTIVNPQVFDIFRVAILMLKILTRYDEHDFDDRNDYSILHTNFAYRRYNKNKKQILEIFDKRLTNKIRGEYREENSKFVNEIADFIKKIANIDENKLSIYWCKDEFLGIVSRNGLGKYLEKKLAEGLNRKYEDATRKVLDKNATTNDYHEIEIVPI